MSLGSRYASALGIYRPPGLTTTESPFIEQAQRDGQLYIAQPYELYSEENHQAWRKLYQRMLAPLGALCQSAFSGRHQLRSASIRIASRASKTSTVFFDR